MSAPEARAALIERGEALGRELRSRFGVRGGRDARRLLRLAYRAIGIDLRARPDGAVVVTRCAFASDYTPATCRTISGLDEGLMRGILGPGRLEFAERLTEGRPCCTATFVPERTA